ncbi:hypothetical protein B4U79_03268 [Dinothrombium tinctorium]|uniref:hypoxia-inducible factor-proline dioxygenase n=1 Tax=Dinothrombium tinctorium TaxID=1965070 RepID=A0A443QUU8_9ACAR|nr:hypothetical protein B4U79_03268 [Dinothrombium tinctorium]
MVHETVRSEERCEKKFKSENSVKSISIEQSVNSKYSSNLDQNANNKSKSDDNHSDVINKFKAKCSQMMLDLSKYGVGTIDHFLGDERCSSILLEVKFAYENGFFTDGQLVRNSASSSLIRSDKVMHVKGDEKWAKNISHLMTVLEKTLITCGVIPSNEQLGDYRITRRTKAMVSCYPGNGTHYKRHIDNPNNDGRRLTCIYYLNKDWDGETMGGTLRIFPAAHKNLVANIEPIFDRLVLFWSDRRNPHEVLPAYKDRFAITVWYCDG